MRHDIINNIEMIQDDYVDMGSNPDDAINNLITFIFSLRKIYELKFFYRDINAKVKDYLKNDFKEAFQENYFKWDKY